jgi:hypothetical protein
MHPPPVFTMHYCMDDMYLKYSKPRQINAFLIEAAAAVRRVPFHPQRPALSSSSE